MAQISRSRASLRITGDQLDPEIIIELLGCSPTISRKKGDVIIGQKTGNKRDAGFGIWRLRASEKSPENLDGQVQEILGQLTNDMKVWKSLGSRFELDLFCGIFMNEENEGMAISSKTLMELGMRGVKIGLDIYAPVDENSDSDAPQV